MCAPPECIFRFVIGTAQLSGNVIPDLTSADMLQLPELKGFLAETRATICYVILDSYHALTQKVGLSLAWIGENIDTEFVLKADEDTFVNLPKLVDVLKQYGPDLYMGYFSGRARVKKTRRSQSGIFATTICQTREAEATCSVGMQSDSLLAILTGLFSREKKKV